MNEDKFKAFLTFVDDEILPATAELESLEDRSRRHLQKLAYTNLVDRFDSMVDGALLDNCREDNLVSEATRSLTKQVTEADLLKLLMLGSLDEVIDDRLKDGLRTSVLRERHCKKLRVLFGVMAKNEECWNKPRVNPATGAIFAKITPQEKKTSPYSICGYADWLYGRRNAIVHGAGKTLLSNDIKQLKTLFNFTAATAVSIKPASVKNAAAFYRAAVQLLTSK